MDFEIIGKITGIEPIALGRGIRDRRRLQSSMAKGGGESFAGSVRFALSMVHWYEADGIGQNEFKLKLPLLD